MPSMSVKFLRANASEKTGRGRSAISVNQIGDFLPVSIILPFGTIIARRPVETSVANRRLKGEDKRLT